MLKLITIPPRPRGGILGESTNEEAYGVASGEERPVREVMRQRVATAHASMALKEVSNILRAQEASIVVVYEGTDPAHALTEADLSEENLECKDSNHNHYGTLQGITRTRVAVRCDGDAILVDALRIMVKYHLSHVPVVNRGGDLIGALSVIDAIGALQPAAAEVWLGKMRGWAILAPASGSAVGSDLSRRQLRR